MSKKTLRACLVGGNGKKNKGTYSKKVQFLCLVEKPKSEKPLRKHLGHVWLGIMERKITENILRRSNFIVWLRSVNQKSLSNGKVYSLN